MALLKDISCSSIFFDFPLDHTQTTFHLSESHQILSAYHQTPPHPSSVAIPFHAQYNTVSAKKKEGTNIKIYATANNKWAWGPDTQPEELTLGCFLMLQRTERGGIVSIGAGAVVFRISCVSAVRGSVYGPLADPFLHLAFPETKSGTHTAPTHFFTLSLTKRKNFSPNTAIISFFTVFRVELRIELKNLSLRRTFDACFQFFSR